MTRFFYYKHEYEYNRFMLGLKNNKNKIININQNLLPNLVGMNINNFKSTLRKFGGKVDIFGNFYFNNEEYIKSFVEYLNKIKK